MEIVKNLQRLQGIDGDYDNDSGSGPDRIARRRTIQNLEKARQPRRQIGTLDVAFKKRFLKLTADENNSGTPILTRRMTMRRETIRALEVRKNSVMAERRKSQMQTLGANNEYGITGVNTVSAFSINFRDQPIKRFNSQTNNNAPPRPLRTSNAGVSVKDIFNVNGGPGGDIYGVTGQVNQAYEPVIEDDDRNSLRLQPRNQVTWSNNNGRL